MATRRQIQKGTRALAAHRSLVHAVEAVGRILVQQLAGLGITSGQYHVLEALILHGPMSPAVISARLRWSESNIKLVTLNLQKRGWAARLLGEKNSRAVSIHLTPEGRHLIARVTRLRAKLIRAQMYALTALEQKRLRRLCDKLAAGDARKFVLEVTAVDEEDED